MNDLTTIDIGILTIKEEEFRAVLECFTAGKSHWSGKVRRYEIRTADAGNGHRYRVAILRQIEQGNGEAQAAARDMIEDLDPSLILLVGIAGGLPSNDCSLGDVILSTRILDFTVSAECFGEEREYNVAGGPIKPTIAAHVAHLPACESELGVWQGNLPPKPRVELISENFKGRPDWQEKLRKAMELHYGPSATVRPPRYRDGTIASSDKLIKDPDVMLPWIKTSRALLAVEMESAGVHRAIQGRTSMLSIRALSDIVGFKRDDAWTQYACKAAAAFSLAYLRTRPIPIPTSPVITKETSAPMLTYDEPAHIDMKSVEPVLATPDCALIEYAKGVLHVLALLKGSVDDIDSFVHLDPELGSKTHDQRTALKQSILSVLTDINREAQFRITENQKALRSLLSRLTSDGVEHECAKRSIQVFGSLAALLLIRILRGTWSHTKAGLVRYFEGFVFDETGNALLPRAPKHSATGRTAFGYRYFVTAAVGNQAATAAVMLPLDIARHLARNYVEGDLETFYVWVLPQLLLKGDYEILGNFPVGRWEVDEMFGHCESCISGPVLDPWKQCRG